MRECVGILLESRTVAMDTVIWRVRGGSEEMQPGQFVHIAVGGAHILRRPISLHDVEGDVFSLIIQRKGEGTHRLLETRAGESVRYVGPLGKGFEPPAQGGPVWLVGGGIGVAPLLYAARRFSPAHAVRSVVGFRSAVYAYGVSALAHFGGVDVVTDDGTLGARGFVTDALRARLERGERGFLMVCGPTPMMAAVQKLALEYGLDGQVSLEERMGCGIGGCQVCVCKQKVEGDEFAYKRVCIDGPVLPIGEVDFS